MYGAFASGGRLVDPVFIREVVDRDGKLLDADVPLLHPGIESASRSPDVGDVATDGSTLQQVLAEIRDGSEDRIAGERPRHGDQVLEPEVAYLMTDLLRAVVQEGTGWRAKALGRPLGGKTGTTNEMNDAWFMGFTPEIVAGIWVGYDVAQPLGKNESGSRAASPIFVDFMGRVLRGRAPTEFPVPDGIIFIRMDRKSGLLASPGTDDYLFQPFREGNAPTELAPTNGHGAPGTRAPRLD